MAGDRTQDGYRVRLKPRGAGRFITAGFLGLWLCGWAVGEGFALWILGAGAGALITGEPPGSGSSPLEAGPAVAGGAFLLVWLALWTLGGVAALGQLLRLLWAEDRLTADRGRLRIVRSRGPFRFSKEYPRDAIVRLLIASRGGALVLETARERVELSSLGTPTEREEAARGLRAELALAEQGEAGPVVLPKGWEETITPEGERALAPDAGIRRTQSRVAAMATLAATAIAVFLFHEAWRFPALFPAAVLVTLAAVGLGCGTAWLSHGRMEWRIGNGRVTLRRRFRAQVREIFDGERLEIVVTSDSDGDDWYALEAIRGPGAASTVDARSAKTRQRIVSTMHDPTVPLRLGTWLARAANVPLENRSTNKAREMEIAALLSQLEAAGPLGRFAARFLDVTQAKREKP